MRKRFLWMTLALLVFFTAAGATRAYSAGKKKGLKAKFFHKVCLLDEYRDNVGLSDEDMRKVWQLKMETKKTLIRKGADIELAALDIKEALNQDEIDIPALEQFVDKKYELKKEKSKALVAAYARLKNMLTAEQEGTLKELWREKERPCPCFCPLMREGMMRSMMRGGMTGEGMYERGRYEKKKMKK